MTILMTLTNAKMTFAKIIGAYGRAALSASWGDMTRSRPQAVMVLVATCLACAGLASCAEPMESVRGTWVRKLDCGDDVPAGEAEFTVGNDLRGEGTIYYCKQQSATEFAVEFNPMGYALDGVTLTYVVEFDDGALDLEVDCELIDDGEAIDCHGNMPMDAAWSRRQ